MPRGGKRPGAGRKFGTVEQSTLEKREARDFIRQLVRANLEPMVQAQIENAKGVSYMVLRHDDGTFARATEVKQIDAACAVGASAFQIFTQQPNTQAFISLTDRAFDKPSEHLELTGADGGPVELITRLAAARARLKRQ